MQYERMTESDVGKIAELYMDYYNHEGGSWTYEKAYKRLHQMVTIEDSLCLMQKNEAGAITGVAVGYFQEYDDRSFYDLEEIVVFAEYQNKGYGKQLLREIERHVLERGAGCIELLSLDDEHHMRFYHGFGMSESASLKVMSKHYRCSE